MLKNLFLATVTSAVFTASLTAQAILPLQQPRTKRAIPFGVFTFGFDLTYQIGAEWGKKPMTMDSLKNETEAVRRAALATARVGGGTGFYLGLFDGKYVMATNHHVMPGAENCDGTYAIFPLLNVRLACTEFLGDWTDIDLALFVISTPTPEEAGKLAKVAANFAFDKDTYKGQELVTIGFGIGDNPRRQLMGNQDSDCKVFSTDAEYRFMGDPDDLNPAPYKAWSFSNGCDVSHGDSGSAMVDRKTSEPMGIIWTGKIPKSKKVQDANYIADIYRTSSEDVWKELSFAVPARKIGEFLANVVSDPNTDADVAKTISSVLGQ